MIPQHPLGFFIDFIEHKQLKQFEDEFFNLDMREEEIPVEDIRNQTIVKIELPNFSETKITRLQFKDFLYDKFEEERVIALKGIEQLLFEQDAPKSLSTLSSLIASIDILIKKATLYEEAANYPSILNCYMELKHHISHITEGIKPSPTGAMTEDIITIKWLANKNQLAQLFFDLLNGQDGHHPFISIEKPLLAKFLLKHFTDDKGQPIKYNTIEKYMRTDDDEQKRPKPHTRFTFPQFKKNSSKP